MAIGVGFVGVMMIVRPCTDAFDIWSLYALFAIFCVTIRDLAARRLSRDVPSLSVALAAAGGVLLFSITGAAFTEWQPVSVSESLILIGAIVCILGGYLFSVTAMRQGEIAFVAPFRYTSLVVALILGLAVFGEWPDGMTLIGAGIVVATGIYTFYREAKLARANAA